jgi:hypothetical protein
MATARQVSLVASSVFGTDGKILASGKVYFYKVGTTTLKDVWVDGNKTTVSANPVILDARGTAEVYGDGEYKVVIKDSSDVAVDEFDNFQFEPVNTTEATLGIDASTYGSDGAAIASAISAASSANKTVFLKTQTWNVTADLTIPTNINLQFIGGAYLNISSGITVTVSGEIQAPYFNIFQGAGNVSISKINHHIPSVWVSSVTGTVSYTSGTNTHTLYNDVSVADNLAVTGNATVGGTLGVTGVSTLSEANITTLKIGGSAVTSTAAELNILDGVTSTAAELNLNDGSVSETIVNNKSVVYGADGQVNAKSIKIQGTEIVDSDKNFSVEGLVVNKSLTQKLVSKTATYTAADESVILVDSTSGVVTINLPTAASIAGRIYTIKKIDSSVNKVTIDPSGSETMDGETTLELIGQYGIIKLISDGTNWNSLGYDSGWKDVSSSMVYSAYTNMVISNVVTHIAKFKYVDIGLVELAVHISDYTFGGTAKFGFGGNSDDIPHPATYVRTTCFTNSLNAVTGAVYLPTSGNTFIIETNDQSNFTLGGLPSYSWLTSFRVRYEI